MRISIGYIILLSPDTQRGPQVEAVGVPIGAAVRIGGDSPGVAVRHCPTNAGKMRKTCVVAPGARS